MKPTTALIMALGRSLALLALPALLVLLAGPLPAQEPSPAAPAEKSSEKNADAGALARPAEGLLFVGDEDNEPFSYTDKQGEPAGFDVEAMQLIAAKAGKKVTVRLLPRQAALDAAANGKADGIIGLGIPTGDDKLAPEWRWCGPTVGVDYLICVRQDNTDITDLDSLNGVRVAVLNTDAGMVQMLFANNPGVTTVAVDDVYKGCLWVNVHRALAMVADRNAIQYFARQRSEQFKLKFVGVPVFRLKDYGPAVSMRGSETLAQDLKKAVKQLSDDGSLEKLRNKWFAFDLNPTSLMEEAWVKISLLSMAVLAALAMAALTWRWQLGAVVERRTRKLSAEMEVLRRQHAADLQNHTEEGGKSARKETVPQVAGDALGAAPVDLNELVRGMAEPIKHAAGEAVAIALSLGEDLPMVDADADRVRTALLNLVTNARDAIAERRRQDASHPARIWVTTRMGKPDDLPPAKKGSTQEFVALSVRDTGCGLAPAEVQKIFEAGYSTKTGAAGHGLTIVYGIIAQHGGWIDVESAPARGATFSLFLPVADV